MSRPLTEIEKQYQSMIMNLTPARRLFMACDMFTTARTLAIAGLLANDPELSGVALKRALLKRLYGRDFPPDVLEKISSQLGTT